MPFFSPGFKAMGPATLTSVSAEVVDKANVKAVGGFT